MLVIPPWLDEAVTAAVYGFAVAKGRGPERIIGGFAGAIWAWNSFAHRRWFGPHDGYELVIDLGALAVTLALTLRRERWWLVVASIALVLRVAVDIADFVIPLHGWAYGTALMTWGYVFLAALAACTWESWRGQCDATKPASA